MPVDDSLLIEIITNNSTDDDPSIFLNFLKSMYENKTKSSWSADAGGVLISKYIKGNDKFTFHKVSPGKHRVSLSSSAPSSTPSQEPEIQQDTSNDGNTNQSAPSIQDDHQEETVKEESVNNEVQDESVEKEGEESVENETVKEEESLEKEQVKETVKEEVKKEEKKVERVTRTNQGCGGYDVEEEIATLLKIIKPNCNENDEITFKTIFDDDDVQNSIESISGTLKAAKKRKIVSYKPELLLQGMSDNVIITVLSWPEH